MAKPSEARRSFASRLHDETRTKTNMTALRLGAARARLIDKVPHGHWKTTTFLSALRNDRIDAPCVFDGPINGERFRAYVEQFLVPTLKRNDIVVLDNLGPHKGKAVRERSEAAGGASCSFQNTRPTSIRSSRSSPSSRLRPKTPRPERSKPARTPSPKTSPTSRHTNGQTISPAQL